jgi:hypothetical protein
MGLAIGSLSSAWNSLKSIEELVKKTQSIDTTNFCCELCDFKKLCEVGEFKGECLK